MEKLKVEITLSPLEGLWLERAAEKNGYMIEEAAKLYCVYQLKQELIERGLADLFAFINKFEAREFDISSARMDELRSGDRPTDEEMEILVSYCILDPFILFQLRDRPHRERVRHTNNKRRENLKS
ncbi:hypothetical protein [Roseofilum capinflatum]|uniref:Uncharacterized protein n=1 Tax=Roseofilum capinflatum BLCC-M114 TaxID=3022440 RepID=A0ABT7B9E3_9CYAN|nr:hypothetical protein [Roseofilum capinflatum]MDJ1174893.1 hypothetical protein [Roseofilum capinflatum BLCC-M114]